MASKRVTNTSASAKDEDVRKPGLEPYVNAIQNANQYLGQSKIALEKLEQAHAQHLAEIESVESWKHTCESLGRQHEEDQNTIKCMEKALHRLSLSKEQDEQLLASRKQEYDDEVKKTDALKTSFNKRAKAREVENQLKIDKTLKEFKEKQERQKKETFRDLENNFQRDLQAQFQNAKELEQLLSCTRKELEKEQGRTATLQKELGSSKKAFDDVQRAKRSLHDDYGKLESTLRNTFHDLGLQSRSVNE